MAASSDAQNLFDHFDTYWFTHQIFKKNQKYIVETDQNLDFHSDINNINKNLSLKQIKNLDSIKQQQQSDSPNSVLMNLYSSPKLETIFSGKESREIPEEREETAVKVKKAPGRSRPKERKKNSSGKKSKSLSELEFQELKGFMDLGFSFSEKDKDSKLVSIIPGLQRLGKPDCEDEQAAALDDEDRHLIVSSRPYLSEAWDEIENNKRELLEPLIIRIPAAFGNEVEIKDQLKCWAHSVAASVVR